MENVRTSYLVVGVLEDYERFLKLAEILLPKFFNGSLPLYQSMYTKLRNHSKTAYKVGFH